MIKRKKKTFLELKRTIFKGKTLDVFIDRLETGK